MINMLIDVATRGLGGLFKPSEEPGMSVAESRGHKETFIKEQAPIIQCWKG